MIKEKVIKLQDGANTLTFKIRKMPAMQGAEWMAKAGFLLGSQVDNNVLAQFMGATAQGEMMVAALTLAMKTDYDKARPLFMELLSCCARIDAGVEQVCSPETVDAFIEDPVTIMKLVKEAATFNFSSYLVGSQSNQEEEAPDQGKRRPVTKSIKTSRG